MNWFHFFAISVLYLTTLHASEKNEEWEWTKNFTLVNRIVVRHTPAYIQYDYNTKEPNFGKSNIIYIPAGTADNGFEYKKSFCLRTQRSLQEFIKDLIESGAWNNNLEDSYGLTELFADPLLNSHNVDN
ncbi:hypothetical protein [Candidatus Paracaedibacter symbiosus]|uniref:hypothetical protein n=1 Tax=Candidatus Paracaedibacter symbiosus TaxID=244582 RepID=UPI0012EB878D|nr:hypothetical protein [Candidatus Paracaedibacter symbiosus]